MRISKETTTSHNFATNRAAKMDVQHESPIQLQIIIVGAGIAGFAAAIALRRAGHKVKLFEKSSFGREAGFGISIAPNGSKVLSDFGFDFSKARAVPCYSVLIRNGGTFDTETHFTFDKHSERWVDKWFTILRPDIHGELRRLAMSEDDDGPMPELVLGAKVVAVNIEKGSVTLEDGTTHTADLVIGADGEKSVLGQAVGEVTGQLRESPLCMFRNIVPLDAILSDPISRRVYESRKNSFTMFVKESDFRGVAWFDCRDGNVFDLGAWYTNRKADGSKKVTKEMDVKEAMLREFSDFHPDLVHTLKKSTNVTNWTINFAGPHSNWSKAKGLLVGDAAHSMFPTTGQGGCQALEDAGALSVLLSGLENKSDVPERLRLHDQLRRDRACTIQAMSGTILGRERNLDKRMHKYLPGQVPFPSAAALQEYHNTYDVIAESKRLVKAHYRRTHQAKL